MYVSSYSYTVVTYFYDYIPTITLPVNRSAHPRPFLHCAFGTGTFPASERVGEVSTFNSSASGESGFRLCVAWQLVNKQNADVGLAFLLDS